ncbi:hypothetical protein CRYUN_Cryun27aG0052100 [Craigia yunnanensis]
MKKTKICNKMMSKEASNCAICDKSNRRSRRLRQLQGKADDQLNWKVSQNEKLTNLKEKLRRSKEQLAQGKAKIERVSHDLRVKYGVLESACATLKKKRVEQLEKFYPNLLCTQSLRHIAITSERLHKQSVVIKQICKLFPQRRVTLDGERRDASSGRCDLICNARLPRGLDPHSVPSEELASSLGYMVQLLNLVFHNLAVPALHNSGFAFHLRDLVHGYGNEILIEMHALLLEDRSSSNFGVASMESERRPRLDSSRSKQVQQLNKSVWNVNSAMSSSTLLESAYMLPLTKNFSDHNLPSSAASFLFATEMSDIVKNGSPIDEWDLVEHPTFPPPPLQTEDVEHWTRAMFIDATRR